MSDLMKYVNELNRHDKRLESLNYPNVCRKELGSVTIQNEDSLKPLETEGGSVFQRLNARAESHRP